MKIFKLKPRRALIEKTPEQAAAAILSALEFLRDDSDELGRPDMSKLILRARAKARKRSSGV